MAHETYASAVGNIYLPKVNDNTYPSGTNTLYDSLKFIADNCYSSGNLVPTAGIADNAITADKITPGTITSTELASTIGVTTIANDVYFKWDNAAASATNIMKYNASDLFQIDVIISKLRYKNDTYFLIRNNANGADVNVFKLDTGDDLFIDTEISKLLMKQNVYALGRNAANSANINGWKINASDLFEIGVATTINGALISSQLDINIGASGDPKIVWDINGTDKFYAGVDDTDSDKFKIGTGAAVGTNTAFDIDSSGRIIAPLQPWVLATAGNNANVTGNSTEWTVVWNTEIKDIGSHFATNTFTAPVTAPYLISVSISYEGATSATNYTRLKIVTSNRSFTFYEVPGTDTQFGFSGLTASFVMDMDAADTMTATFTVFGEASDVIDVNDGNLSIKPLL